VPVRNPKTGEFDPILKPTRTKSRKAIETARKKFCEYCLSSRGPFQVHHLSSRAAGGHDADDNLITLCVGPKTNDCHGKAHTGEISRATLEEIVRRRDPPPAQ
jgi:5-methylcytosine-specific restriction endonuclease McrA